MFTVFLAHLARPAAVEAEALAAPLGLTAYETRLALQAAPPTVILSTRDHGRATDLLALLRGRGHGSHLFDRMRERSTMAVYDDRLLHRRVAEQWTASGDLSSRDAIDRLAHLLAMTIANQGGSPYRSAASGRRPR